MNTILQMKPWYGIEETQAISNYLSSDPWITEFKKTSEFEELLAKYLNVKHCIAVSNGTISLTLAALALGIGFGDEVLVPNYTMIATPNSVKMIGANPIFVDVEPETLCIDFELIRQAITPKTKAIILVLANGRYPKTDIDNYVKFANANNLFLIEDAAQSIGSYYKNGKHQGTVGDVGSLSFSSPKIISTGQGGAVITNSDEIANKIRKLKDFGREKGMLDIHNSIGYNFKITDLQAVIGIEQVKKIPYRVKRKKEIIRRYQDNLKLCKEIKFFNADYNLTTPWFIDCLVENRDGLVAYLKDKKIETRLMYPPINLQEAYKSPGRFVNSEFVGKNGLWLPSFTQISNEEIDFVSQAIIDFYRNER